MKNVSRFAEFSVFPSHLFLDLVDKEAKEKKNRKKNVELIKNNVSFGATTHSYVAMAYIVLIIH